MAGEQIGNLSDNMLVPAYLREQYLKLVDEYDNKWQPLFESMMPRVIAEGRGSKHYWTRPRMADPQMIAKFYENDERIELMAHPHARVWTYNTRMTANMFRRNKREFAGDFKGGILERKHAMLLENLTKSINRNIEYTLCQFALGNTETTVEFTNQDTNRQAYCDIQAGSFRGIVDSGLDGVRWDNFSGGTGNHAKIFDDLAYLTERFEYLQGESPTIFYIGRKTALALEKNENLLKRLIYFHDTTDGVLGATVQGLKLVKITGQTYKEVPGVETLAEGYPGKGDYLELDWEHLNRKDMMVEVSGNDSYEWGIITNGNAGEVACGWVDEDHQARGSPTNIFIEQWDERNPKQVFTTAKLEYCPEVYDYSKIMLVKRLSQQ
ncbi:hypothetical protein LCGC14_1127300 [marine sediment metagenome]|uniref:Major capsid protein n=1 Tax=marine sediment metagenome TaxID=412755 RepID=A0A0F9Q7Y6_9ZZZZ